MLASIKLFKILFKRDKKTFCFQNRKKIINNQIVLYSNMITCFKI